jgi:hypothetical protein
MLKKSPAEQLQADVAAAAASLRAAIAAASTPPRQDFTDLALNSSSTAETFLSAVISRPEILDAIKIETCNSAAINDVEKFNLNVSAAGTKLIDAYVRSTGSTHNGNIYAVLRAYMPVVKSAQQFMTRFAGKSLKSLNGLRSLFFLARDDCLDEALSKLASAADESSRFTVEAADASAQLAADYAKVWFDVVTVMDAALLDRNKAMEEWHQSKFSVNTAKDKCAVFSAATEPAITGLKEEERQRMAAVIDERNHRHQVEMTKEVSSGIGVIVGHAVSVVAGPIHLVTDLLSSVFAAISSKSQASMITPESPNSSVAVTAAEERLDVVSGQRMTMQLQHASGAARLELEYRALEQSAAKANEIVQLLDRTLKALGALVVAFETIKDYWKSVEVMLGMCKLWQ